MIEPLDKLWQLANNLNQLGNEEGYPIFHELRDEIQSLQQTIAELEADLKAAKVFETSYRKDRAVQAEKIAELEARLAERKWVSVEDRLPVKMDRYDCWLSGTEDLRPIRLTNVIWSEPHGGWIRDDGKPLTYTDRSITHWQPLPPPPEDE